MLQTMGDTGKDIEQHQELEGRTHHQTEKRAFEAQVQQSDDVFWGMDVPIASLVSFIWLKQHIISPLHQYLL